MHGVPELVAGKRSQAERSWKDVTGLRTGCQALLRAVHRAEKAEPVERHRYQRLDDCGWMTAAG